MRTLHNIGINNGTHNPPVNQIAVVRFASGKHEPVKIGGTTRTNNIIRRQQANENVLNEFNRVIGMAKLEERAEQQREARRAKRGLK